MSNITKPDVSSSHSLVGGKLKSTTSPFRQRIAEGQAQEVDSAKMPNRIALMLDCSGSMQGDSLEKLKEAVQNFAQRCNFADTAIAIETFPRNRNLDLTTSSSAIFGCVTTLEAAGGTPMRKCVEWCIEGISMTRAVIVSDGAATDWHNYNDDSEHDDYEALKPYVEQKIPIDCVHIGSGSGEELLKKIAEKTGGIFLKFTDVSKFSTAFGYLAPAFRGMLTSGSMTAKDIGAKEIVE